MDNPKITIDTFRKAGFCRQGISVKCMQLGLDPKETMKRLHLTGIPVSEVSEIDDAQVQRLVEIAREQN